jgi:transposase
LSRVLDKLLPLKAKLESHLKERMGELFGIEYDPLLYDVTSTYFEGQAKRNEDAAFGYSRDHRGDCRQVCVALVVTRCGMPLTFEVFGGNRGDVTTVEEMVETVEARFGRADRIWVMDRGMVSRENLEFMREGGRFYIVGTPKGELKRFERELLSEDWETVRDGLEVKLCPSPEGYETFILCRSRDRAEKERAILSRFQARIEKGLGSLKSACEKRKMKPHLIERRVGRLLGRNTRAESLFHVDVNEREDGSAEVVWTKEETFRAWASLVEGCYLLRSNVTDWTADELWRAYVQLTEAEAAFRIEKSDLGLRPVWHQKAERVEAHILVCFLALVLWTTLARLCSSSGLGDDPRKVLDELKGSPAVDVGLPTRGGPTLRRRCVARPTDHQRILLQHLGLTLPKRPIRTPM